MFFQSASAAVGTDGQPGQKLKVTLAEEVGGGEQLEEEINPISFSRTFFT